MAFRASGYLRSMLRGLGGKRSLATSATPAHDAHNAYNKYAMSGEFAPVYMVMGMVMVALSIGTHTAKQQLVHCPNVSVSKKKRRSLSEVDDPDRAVVHADRFVNKSFLRKMAHIQEHNRVLPSVRPDPFTKPRNADTLKTAGVDPSRP